MDTMRLTIGRTLVPIAPFVAVILAPNLVFLEVTSRVENRPTIVTIRFADGRTVTESKQKDVKMVDLHWRLGPYALSSSTKTASVLTIESGCRNLGDAANAALMRARSWGAVLVFPIALTVWLLTSRGLAWHSRPAVPAARRYPSRQTVAMCMGVLGVFVLGFVLMKPWWSSSVHELVWWYRFSVGGVVPFLSIVLIIPASEELVFRSGVCRILVERLGPVVGILLQAVLFGSVHLATPLHVAVGFIGGVVLGTVYVFTRSLKAAIFLHAGANGLLAVACLVAT